MHRARADVAAASPAAPAGAARELGQERRVVQGREAGGLGRLLHPHQARGVPRQRHGRQRPGAAVQLRGDAGVRARVAEGGGNRGSGRSSTSAWRCRPPCGRSKLRPSAATASAAVSVSPSASSMRTCSSPGSTLTTADVGSQRRPSACRLPRYQSAALRAALATLAPKLGKPSSSRLEQHLRRPQQTAAIIDDAHALQGGALLRAQLPNAQVFQELDAAGQQRRRAPIGLARERDRRRGAATATSAPRAPRARAAVSPAGPAPITATWAVRDRAMHRSLGHAQWTHAVPRASRTAVSFDRMHVGNPA